MKIYQTLLGPATIDSVRLERTSGYGHYNLVTDFTIGSESHTVKAKFADSENWDRWNEIEDPAEAETFIFDHMEYLIESSVITKSESI